MRRYYFIFETLIGFGLLLAIDVMFVDSSVAFEGVHPHPYWIVVVLMAARYGTWQGVFAGGTAALLFVGLLASWGTVDFAVHTFPHGPFKYPFLFILTGGILGEIRRMYKKRHLKLEQQYHEARDDLQDLGLLYAALTDSKRELEKRIAFQSGTMLNLIERFNAMETLEPEALYRKSLELLHEQLNVTSSSIYLMKNSRLHLFTRLGEEEASLLPDTMELRGGMIGEVVATKKTVTISQQEFDDRAARSEEVGLVMSAPIMLRDETLIAVVNVERMPFFDFTGNAVRIFSMMCHWISMVVDKSLQFERLKDRNVEDEITGAYNYPYFQKRLQYEISRARRFNAPLSLVLLRIDKFEQMDDSEKKNVLVVLHWLFSHQLRDIDIISKYKSKDSFAIILPHQTALETDTIVSRLMQEIDAYQLKPFGDRDERLQLQISVSSLQVSEGSYESLLRTAESRLDSEASTRVTDVFSDIQYLVTATGNGE